MPSRASRSIAGIATLWNPYADSRSARVRRYTATITDETNGLHVQLSDANFIPHANFMFGYVTIDGANLDVNDADYYYGIGYPPPDLGEILPDGTLYCPSGSIAVSTVGANLAGTLTGTIRIRSLPSGNLFSECPSTHHSLTFTRQNASPARVRARR